MDDKFQYRLSKNQKAEIAQNLIDILQKDSEITKQTKVFIGNWILSGPDEKRKAFFDVWDMVLKNYLPIKWHYYINEKFDSIQNLDMRMFFPKELDEYLSIHGFEIVNKFGGFKEEIFEDKSEKQIFVCKKQQHPDKTYGRTL